MAAFFSLLGKQILQPYIIFMDFLSTSYNNCMLCPRQCHVDRTASKGYCQCGSSIKIARAALHQWEEPCISGTLGSGTVFFSGCTLRCCFCQNSKISQHHFGTEITPQQLADIFLTLQSQGAHNINLVTATQYLPSILKALDLSKHKLHIPIVYNCGGYEGIETVLLLKDYVDIWLPDLKYMDPELSMRYSQAPDYFEKASEAILKMVEISKTPLFVPLASALNNTSLFQSDQILTGIPEQPEQYLMLHGVIIRHLVLPGAKKDSIHLLEWIQKNLPKGQYLISLMSQYTPYHVDSLHPELNRRITSYEYQQVVDTALSLGLQDGFMQKKSSAKEEYTPPFNLEGCPCPEP